MIHFPTLRMLRLTVQLRELTINESIKIASMPVHLKEASVTAFLRFATESVAGNNNVVAIEDPAHWTVQERIMAVCHYLASTSEGNPDFTIGGGGKYSDYLDGGNNAAAMESLIKAGDVGGDAWHLRHLTGAMAESIERMSGEIDGISGRLHWLLGGMASQMTREGENTPSPVDGEGIFDEFLVTRMKVMAGYPESDFAALLGLYLTGREKLHHLFITEFSENGIVSLPKGGAAGNLPPAQFPVIACISGVVRSLVGVANESGI